MRTVLRPRGLSIKARHIRAYFTPSKLELIEASYLIPRPPTVCFVIVDRHLRYQFLFCIAECEIGRHRQPALRQFRRNAISLLLMQQHASAIRNSESRPRMCTTNRPVTPSTVKIFSSTEMAFLLKPLRICI